MPRLQHPTITPDQQKIVLKHFNKISRAEIAEKINVSVSKLNDNITVMGLIGIRKGGVRNTVFNRTKMYSEVEYKKTLIY